MKKQNNYITRFLEGKKPKKNDSDHPWNVPISEKQRKEKEEKDKELYNP